MQTKQNNNYNYNYNNQNYKKKKKKKKKKKQKKKKKKKYHNEKNDTKMNKEQCVSNRSRVEFGPWEGIASKLLNADLVLLRNNL